MSRAGRSWWGWAAGGLVLGLMGMCGPEASAAAVLEGRTLRYEDGAQLVWQRSYPAARGDLSGPLEVGGAVYLGVGPKVYVYSAAGRVLGRADLPGPVTTLDASGGVVRVSTAGDGYAERFTLAGGAGGVLVQERVVLPPDPAVTGWLLSAALAVPEAGVQAAASEDPTNPFLLLRLAGQRRAQGDSYAALSAVRRALGTSLPFPAWVQLAAQLDASGYPAAADLALDRARRDAASRGIDPDVPVGRTALAAYGNPSAYVGTLLNQNRLARAAAWMAYLRELHPRFEGGPALYERYAGILEAQGRAGEAEEWRQFSRSLRAGTLYNLGPDGLGSVRDAARLVTLTLLLALGAALAAVTLRAWRPQGLATRPLGGRLLGWLRRPLARARYVAVAYASLSERLLLTLLLAGLVASLGGWQWANLAGAALRAPALNIGTYGGGWGSAGLSDLNLRPGPDSALLSGLAAQLDGDDAVARQIYTAALPDACALNNLGAISQARGDEAQAREQYRAALTGRPDLGAAAFNLGLNPNTPDASFQRSYRPGQSRLCYPDQRSVTRAVTGDLSVTLRQALLNPAQVLTPAPGRSARLGWALLVAALLAAAMLVSLLLPRTPLTPAQARAPLVRALTLLLPGTGLMGSPWGGMLLLLWAAAVAALAPLAGGATFPALPLLASGALRGGLIAALTLSYFLNTVILLTAEVRHYRRSRWAARAEV
ncbi:hypothetical protein GCM10010840_34810 [Deinococcus aerolatus]|uniref:Tetratricopeptide repeat-containing protein n=1 Tax=Deinococcus aerolatus TaxID=522487 RepID=A0ABQ2GFX7_9DEIO|nr:hypothetical protein [Deinococcus aerolatus]GGL93837.1 hypothetical protein GCM10010840_34810 [Deinococcus aerolatus]